MKHLFSLLLFSICLYGSAQEVQEIHQRAKIYFDSHEELLQLSQLGIPVDHGVQPQQMYVLSDFSISEVASARNAGYTVEVLIENSKAHYLKQNEKLKHFRRNSTCDETYITPENFGTGTMGGYFTYQEALDQLDLMFALYPNLITAPENISTFLTEGEPDNSTTPLIGGNGIKWVKISDNPNSSSEAEPETLYTSIHHAREPTSLSQLIFYMWYLLENYDSNPEIKNIVDNTELYFVPVVNPDGYLYNEKTDPEGGGFWRKNRKDITGVDNNRNYDYYIDGDPTNNIWGGEGTSTDPNSNIYPGTAPFSEVENQAIKWLCEQHDFVMGINNHSFGNGIFFPYGYTSTAFTPEHDLYLAFLEELTSQNDYFFQKTMGIAGTANDFMYGTIGTHDRIFSTTPEIGDTFWLPSNEIIKVCKDMMYHNITIAKMTNGGSKITDLQPLYVGIDPAVVHNFALVNLGLRNTGDFTVTMNAISTNITSVGPAVTLNTMDPMEERQEAIPYSLAAGTAAGDDIVFELIVSNGIYDETILIEKKFGNLEAIFQDPGDNTTDNFNENQWGVTPLEFVSPSTSITDSPTGNYISNLSKPITLSQPIDLTGAVGAVVSFYARWNIEELVDHTQFEISTDNGNTWVPQCGNYTTDGTGIGVQPLGEPLYEGSQEEWVLEEIDLTQYLGETILARFQIETDPLGTRDGFYFDDLTFYIATNEELSIAEVEKALYQVYPNPVKDVISITTPVDNYDLKIYDLQGKLLLTKDKNHGTQQINLGKFPTGVYLLKLSTDTTIQTLRIVKQ